MSLGRARELAFAGRLAQAERALAHNDVVQARWIRAYIAAARGDFATAERTAQALLRARGADPVTRRRAAVTLGSVLRQTGRHARARTVERAALRGAAGTERIHLQIGLVADAVGLGDLRGVDAALARIGRRRVGDWRVRVRLSWVRCERELLAGRPAAAATYAARALNAAERAGARRHVAKSLLFSGAALIEAGRPVAAERALRRSRALAARIGAAPVADVAAELLGRL